MDGFDQFYSRYPRKEARGDAEKAWRQVRGDQHLDAILAALEWQVPLLLERERQFRKLPSTWLRARCWEDEHPAMAEQARRAVQAAADAEWLARRKQIEAEAMERGER